MNMYDPAIPANTVCDVPAPSLPGNDLHRTIDKSTNDERSAEKRNLERRDFLYVNVCIDADYLGLCQQLGTYTGNCYSLVNGFDDSISSLELNYSSIPAYSTTMSTVTMIKGSNFLLEFMIYIMLIWFLGL
ncbi:hypothetical protein OIDMADRAFT_55965 [Oidiodendron maius Zn]|uniref:Uncharacterized protein n=1 Tax=Oidiodendron maius (strain Zn) TaxID=913774 RepID=A0A0C3CM31_OIDMZ|nr:hypothetical protein OIDMADRAFT_55965 [Oidiodendron maius Zn]